MPLRFDMPTKALDWEKMDAQSKSETCATVGGLGRCKGKLFIFILPILAFLSRTFQVRHGEELSHENRATSSLALKFF